MTRHLYLTYRCVPTYTCKLRARSLCVLAFILQGYAGLIIILHRTAVHSTPLSINQFISDVVKIIIIKNSPGFQTVLRTCDGLSEGATSARRAALIIIPRRFIRARRNKTSVFSIQRISAC